LNTTFKAMAGNLFESDLAGQWAMRQKRTLLNFVRLALAPPGPLTQLEFTGATEVREFPT